MRKFAAVIDKQCEHGHTSAAGEKEAARAAVRIAPAVALPPCHISCNTGRLSARGGTGKRRQQHKVATPIHLHAVVCPAEKPKEGLGGLGTREHQQDKATKESATAADVSPEGGSTKPARRYGGVVKYFRGSFGWISCPEISARFGGRDVFLHKMDSDIAPRLGDRVSFTLTRDSNGDPKAAAARVET